MVAALWDISDLNLGDLCMFTAVTFAANHVWRCGPALYHEGYWHRHQVRLSMFKPSVLWPHARIFSSHIRSSASCSPGCLIASSINVWPAGRCWRRMSGLWAHVLLYNFADIWSRKGMKFTLVPAYQKTTEPRVNTALCPVFRGLLQLGHTRWHKHGTQCHNSTAREQPTYSIQILPTI